jgi:hypothetical protein
MKMFGVPKYTVNTEATPSSRGHPEKPRPHRSDRCLSTVWPVPTPIGFCSGEHLGEFAVVPCWVWVGLELSRHVWCFGAFWPGPIWPVCCTGLTDVVLFYRSHQISPAGTSLTRGAHRPDRRRSVRLEFLCSAAFSGLWGWELVPRSSSTLVAAWAWPTSVVSRRRVLEAVFILLEHPSPSRRIFIDSHSLPPLWFVVSVLHLVHSKA